MAFDHNKYKRQTCDKCGGEGMWEDRYNMTWITCGRCDGEGAIEVDKNGNLKPEFDPSKRDGYND